MKIEKLQEQIIQVLNQHLKPKQKVEVNDGIDEDGYSETNNVSVYIVDENDNIMVEVIIKPKEI